MPVLNWSLVLMSMGMGLPSEESDASFEAAVLAELKEAVHTQLAEEVRDLEASLFPGADDGATPAMEAAVEQRLSAEVGDLEAALFARLEEEVRGNADLVKAELEAVRTSAAASFVEVNGAAPKLLPFLLESAEAFQLAPPASTATRAAGVARQQLVMAEETPQERAARERANDPAYKQQEEWMEKSKERQGKKKERGMFDGPEKCESDFQCPDGEVCCDFQLGKFCFTGKFCFNGGSGARVKLPQIPGMNKPKIAGWPEYRAPRGVLRASVNP